jgi:hypothetical protein
MSDIQAGVMPSREGVVTSETPSELPPTHSPTPGQNASHPTATQRAVKPADESQKPNHDQRLPANPTGLPQLSAATEEILKRVNATTSTSSGSPDYAAARESVMKGMATSANVSTPSNPRGSGRGRGRGRGKAVTISGPTTPIDNGTPTTPLPASGSSRGSGRGSGRGRGSSRGRGRGRGRGGSKAGKRTKIDDERDSVGFRFLRSQLYGKTSPWGQCQ